MLARPNNSFSPKHQDKLIQFKAQQKSDILISLPSQVKIYSKHIVHPKLSKPLPHIHFDSFQIPDFEDTQHHSNAHLLVSLLHSLMGVPFSGIHRLALLPRSWGNTSIRYALLRYRRHLRKCSGETQMFRSEYLEDLGVCRMVVQGM
jgi:hypothetical protein